MENLELLKDGSTHDEMVRSSRRVRSTASGIVAKRAEPEAREKSPGFNGKTKFNESADFLQVLFLTAMVFNLLVIVLLFFVENPDRTRVEPPARVGSFPGPFEQRVGADAEAIHRAQEQHVVVALLIGLWGMFSVLSLSKVGIAFYLCLAAVNVIIDLGTSPDALYACRYMIDIVLIVIGRSLLSTVTYAWVTAAAGDGRP